MDEAFDKMKDLSHGRGDRRRKSKRDKIAQRSAFRDICSFVEVTEYYLIQLCFRILNLFRLPHEQNKEYLL